MRRSFGRLGQQCTPAQSANLGSAIRSTERTADQASWSHTGASGLLEWLQQDKHAYPVPLTSLTSCIAMALSSAVDSVERPERERAEHRTCQRADTGCYL